MLQAQIAVAPHWKSIEMISDELGSVRREVRTILKQRRVRWVLIAFVLWVAVPAFAEAVRRTTPRGIREEGVRRAVALVQNFDIAAARWLFPCPSALVVAVVVQLNLTAFFTLLLAYDSVCGSAHAASDSDQESGATAGQVIVKAAAVGWIAFAAHLVAQLLACAFQSMAHGGWERSMSWSVALGLVSGVFSIAYVALWILVSARARSPRAALLAGFGVGALLFAARAWLHSRVGFPVFPSMLDTWLLSGRSRSIAAACVVSMGWSAGCLMATVASIKRRAASGREAAV